VGDHVVSHTDLGAAVQLNGLSRQPDKTVTEEQFSAADGLVRVINNKIVLGKTEEEKAEDKKQAEISEYKAKLAELDKEAGSGRAVRDISMRLAEENGLTGEDAYKNLKDIEDSADEIREKLKPLLSA